MNFPQGVLHQTTVQTISTHRTTVQAASSAGQKRSHSVAVAPHGRFNAAAPAAAAAAAAAAPAAAPAPAEAAAPAPAAGARAAGGFQRASAITRASPRLVASAIHHVDVDVDAGDGAGNQPSEYSQRRAMAATPSGTADPALFLCHARYGLPDRLVSNLGGLGIRDIYLWQKQCLMGPGILEGKRNLVYAAPTGGGKSLVADVLMLKRVLEEKEAKALLVLPYVALVQEKVRWLRNVVQGLRRKQEENKLDRKERLWRRRADEDAVRIVGFFGGGKIRATWGDFDIGVCTFEKANALINTAIADCCISNLKCIVLDELHMVDDDHRGYYMELLATKLLSLDNGVQIVGMSATLSDMDVLAKWLNAHSYETRYRPVPIEEHLVYDGSIFPASTTSRLLQTASQLGSSSRTALGGQSAVRTIRASAFREFKDPVLNAVVALACETVRARYGALVFCSSRPGCESDARLISRAMAEATDPDVMERRADLVGELRSLPSGIDPVLAETVPFGVAFHHAGLTTEERDLIADAYDKGTLKVLTATCSLAAGINLPARRVILHNARMGRDLVGPSMLRQMRGRAGRKGKDEVGETYLCCRKTDLEEVIELMHAELPQVTSGLMTERHRIRRALLEAIAIRLATGKDSIDEFVGKTLLNLTCNSQDIRAHVDSSLAELVGMGMVCGDQAGNYEPTQLGSAVVASSLDPEDGGFIHREMQRALQAFVMDGEMHTLYTFTPVQELSVSINWRAYRNETENLDESGLRVMAFLGLKPAIINKMAQGGSLRVEAEASRIYGRFYLALQLRDLCNERPVHAVARKFDVPRGTVQTLAQTCQGFAAGMIRFCQDMGWGAMAAVLNHFSDRLRAGAKADLLALAQISFVKSRTARVFYDNGFKSVAMVANAEPAELVPVLMQAQPTKVRLKSTDEQKYEEKMLAKAEVICDSANRLWQLQMQQEVEQE